MSKLYDAVKQAMLDSMSFPETVMMYGPPRSRRGRLLNRIRRLFGREERQELYAQWPDTTKVALVNEVPVTFKSSGVWKLEEDDDADS